MKIQLYTKDNCHYCDSAKNLLKRNNISYEEFKLGINFMREHLLEQYPTARTFPVVVVDGWFLGGAMELTEHLAKLNEPRQLLTEG